MQPSSLRANTANVKNSAKQYYLLVPVNRANSVLSCELPVDGKIAKSINGNIDKSYRKLLLQSNAGQSVKSRPNILSKSPSRGVSTSNNNTRPETRSIVEKPPSANLSFATASDYINVIESSAVSIKNGSFSQTPFNEKQFHLNDGRLVSFCGSLELNETGNNDYLMKFDYQSLLKQFYSKSHHQPTSSSNNNNNNSNNNNVADNSSLKCHSYAATSSSSKITDCVNPCLSSKLPFEYCPRLQCNESVLKAKSPPVPVIDCNNVCQTVTVLSNNTIVLSTTDYCNDSFMLESPSTIVTPSISELDAVSKLSIVVSSNETNSSDDVCSIRTNNCQSTTPNFNKILFDDSSLEEETEEENMILPPPPPPPPPHPPPPHPDISTNDSFSLNFFDKSSTVSNNNTKDVNSNDVVTNIASQSERKIQKDLSSSTSFSSNNKKAAYYRRTSKKISSSMTNGRKHYISGYRNNNWRLWLNEYIKPMKKINQFTQTDPQITEFYACCRHRPYDDMRKERNWFYFYIHQCRTFLPVFRSRKVTVDLNKVKINKMKLLTTRKTSTNAILYQQLKTDPPQLTVKKSRIHKIGVFANEPIPGGTFIIEYVGEVIRNGLVERRELLYRQKGFGSYMFQLDNKFTIDATLKGCVARFINHSCEPNCIAKVIRFENKKHIILIASKK